jgi:hypothetical protein
MISKAKRSWEGLVVFQSKLYKPSVKKNLSSPKSFAPKSIFLEAI